MKWKGWKKRLKVNPKLPEVTPICPECNKTDVVGIDGLLPSVLKCGCGNIYQVVVNGFLHNPIKEEGTFKSIPEF
jgi:hypothetical protein